MGRSKGKCHILSTSGFLCIYMLYIYLSCTCIYCKPPQRVDITHMCIYVGYLTVIRLQTYAYMSSKQGALFRTLKKSLVVVGNRLTILLWASIIFVPHTHAFEESIHLLQKNWWLSHFSSISSAWKKIQVCWKKTGKNGLSANSVPLNPLMFFPLQVASLWVYRFFFNFQTKPMLILFILW